MQSSLDRIQKIFNKCYEDEIFLLYLSTEMSQGISR